MLSYSLADYILELFRLILLSFILIWLFNGLSLGGIPGGQQQQQDSGNLRRACSLSDLNKGGQQRRILPSTPGSGKLLLLLVEQLVYN